MLKIKDLKNNQFFWIMKPEWKGDKEKLRVYQVPEIADGVWTVEATCAGDYCWTLNELDQDYLFLDEPK
jgi:hypothetical protein